MSTRIITCVRCQKDMLYKNYRRHLTTCQGSGRLCPICLQEIDVEELDLTTHAINCQRKWLVLIQICLITYLFENSCIVLKILGDILI